MLLIHIVGAAGWIGAGLFAQYAYSRIIRDAPAAAAESFTAIAKKASWYFGVMSGLVLLSGIVLVVTSDTYRWADTFVIIGIAAFVLSGIWQSAVGRRTDARLLTAVNGAGDPIAALSASRRVSSVDLAILVFTIYAMIAKL